MKYRTRLTLALGFVGVVAMSAAAFGQGGGLRSVDRSDAKMRPARENRPAKDRPLAKRNLVTGEFKVKTADGFALVRIDNGVITNVDAAAKTVTLKRADGESVTVTATDRTRIGKDRKRATLADLKNGDLVHVQRVNAGSGFAVRAIRARTPGEAGANEEGAAEGAGFSV